MIVIVVGMHRSGTSALAGLLHNNGIVMGRDNEFHPPPMKENPKGFFENKRFRNINDNILSTNNYRVKSFDPYIPKINKVGTKNWNAMKDLINDYNNAFPIWGFKDPRTCLTLHHWLRAMVDYDVRILFIIRNYEKIAASMRRRGNKEKTYRQFDELACAYLMRVSNVLKETEPKFKAISFNDLLFDTENMAQMISEYLDHDIKDLSFIENKLSKGAK